MRKLLLFPLIASLLILALPARTHADVNDFTVTNFTGDYYLNKNDPQGGLEVKEQLEVNFTDYNHGILRALPQRYNGHPLHLHIDSVEQDNDAEQYTTYTSNGTLVLKIGSPNSTITGAHNYKIDYHVVNVMRFLSSDSELDWNTNGTQWEQPFLSVTARLHLASGLQKGFHEPGCYTGFYKSDASDCTISGSGDTIIYTSDRPLLPGQNMTFSGLETAGVFKQPGIRDWFDDYATTLALLTLPPLFTLLIVGTYWRKNGKDLKGRGTIVPEYGPPDGLKAAEVDTVANYKPGKNAVSATIIDLAIRKYLKIQESESKGVLGVGKHKNYTFVRLDAPAKDTPNDYEASVLAGLFLAGDTTEMSSLKKTFYITAKAVQKALTKNLTASGYFSRDPARAGNAGHVVGAIMVFGSFYLFGVRLALAISIIASGLIVLLFASLMPRRTQKGVDAKDDIEGLKLYMNTAEKDRLAMLQGVDARYAPQSAEPVKTVDLFEKLLPYAMVLGVEQSWGKQFEGIYKTPPDWYGGNWSTFNAVYFTSSLSDSMSAMNSSFAAPSNSNSGSGGGFSGGGGGGGGGGGW